MFAKLFLDHPREVGESYTEHMGVAASFGLTMIWGGLKALLHAFVPAWCKTSGSDTVRRLHQRLASQRGTTAETMSSEWVI